MLIEGVERRRFPRISINCSMTYRSNADDTVRAGTALNLSSDGILFLADRPPAVGAVLRISIPPGKAITPPFDAVIEVLRVYTLPNEASSGTPTFRVAGAVTEMIR